MCTIKLPQLPHSPPPPSPHPTVMIYSPSPFHLSLSFQSETSKKGKERGRGGPIGDSARFISLTKVSLSADDALNQTTSLPKKKSANVPYCTPSYYLVVVQHGVIYFCLTLLSRPPSVRSLPFPISVIRSL